MLNEVREFQKTGQQIVNDLPTVNSYNDCELRYKLMKEENNRILIDHLSTYRFCPTVLSMQNLQDEGLQNNSFLVTKI